MSNLKQFQIFIYEVMIFESASRILWSLDNDSLNYDIDLDKYR